MAWPRVLEVIGGVIGAVYAVLGVVILIEMNLQSRTVDLLGTISEAMFLVLFGAAAAAILFTQSPGVSSRFGFLITFTGRSVFFFLMGLYVYPVVCNRWNDFSDCLSRRDSSLLQTCGVLASASSVILGLVMMVLRCTTVSEDCSWNYVGQRRQMVALDYACMVASIGMVLYAVLLALSLDMRYINRLWWHAFATSAIVLIFGLASLLSSLRVSSFVAAFFGFLEVVWQRGLFYLLMGSFLFAQTMDNSRHRDDLATTICFVCSGISIVAGIIHIVLGFN